MRLFTKQNNSGFKNHLVCEVAGLRRLQKYAKDMKIPAVYNVSEERIEMERVNTRPFDREGIKKLGRGLAQIHKNKSGYYGLEEDNFIGLNPQQNRPRENWGLFFWEERLLYQTKLIAAPKVESAFLGVLNRKKREIVDFLNDHKPYASPLHGDLWSGNALYDGSDPWLIDPAFYFGDREADIAMTRMFGGFGEEFYQAYEEIIPLSPGHEEREIVYNLYHYLNHFNLFGNSYCSKVKEGFAFIEEL